jgi:hypothetical protein
VKVKGERAEGRGDGEETRENKWFGKTSAVVTLFLHCCYTFFTRLLPAVRPVRRCVDRVGVVSQCCYSVLQCCHSVLQCCHDELKYHYSVLQYWYLLCDRCADV